jgi:hypothetical protein
MTKEKKNSHFNQINEGKKRKCYRDETKKLFILGINSIKLIWT